MSSLNLLIRRFRVKLLNMLELKYLKIRISN
jgi:hypothetical protein